jgi:hypothetical protein
VLDVKAGILTFHYAHHYGAQLQAYALMKAIMRLGVDCEIIDYVRRDTVEGSSLFKKGFSARALLSNANTLINYGKLKKRHARFDSFVRDDMRLSVKHYSSYDELKADAPEYDVYVCGSDQIWNPLIFEEKTFDPAFFADFAKSGKRIAYAPSFGISSIPGNLRDTLKEYLDKFDCLSAREKQGEDIIREIAGRESVTVLDPTLLPGREEWAALASAPDFKDPYLLCYFITDGRKYGEAVKMLSDKYGLPVVSLCGSRRVVPSTRFSVMDAGPKEFLGLFANAGAVCTDSFHGTVFSIIFEKAFVCFESGKKAEKAVNSRLYNILGKLGLLSHIYSHTIDAKEFEKRVEETGMPDYGRVARNLKDEREKSFHYLEAALRGC